MARKIREKFLTPRQRALRKEEIRKIRHGRESNTDERKIIIAGEKHVRVVKISSKNTLKKVILQKYDGGPKKYFSGETNIEVTKIFPAYREARFKRISSRKERKGGYDGGPKIIKKNNYGGKRST